MRRAALVLGLVAGAVVAAFLVLAADRSRGAVPLAAACALELWLLNMWLLPPMAAIYLGGPSCCS